MLGLVAPWGFTQSVSVTGKRLRGEDLWQQQEQLLEAVGEQAVKKAADQLQCDSEYEPGRTLTLEVDDQYFHRRW